MCGIAGFHSANFSNDRFERTIVDMLTRIQHRGPDESGYLFDEHGAIGSVRLSVIDLHTGSQPMHDPSGRYWIAYNGEVYNYKQLRERLKEQGYTFSTESDTEVVLVSYIAWGTSCFAKFNGGFALAIYDTQTHELVLARDRFGKRPLFYCTRGNEVFFASELKAFANIPGIEFKWDSEQLASIFLHWTPLPHQTGFKNIQQLPTAGMLIVKDGSIRVSRYAELEMTGETFTGTFDEAAEKTKSLLHESVRLRLQSDVEVGVYLSGGLDSSIVALLATQLNTQTVRTFSVSFADPQYDESSYQQETSAFLGTQHTTLKVSGADIARDFPSAVFHAEVPLFRTALVPLMGLSSLVREHGVKVVLTGEGSDEGFLGYDIFKETYLLDRWHGLDAEARENLIKALYPYLPHYSADNIRSIAANYARFAAPGSAPYMAHSLRFSNSRLALRFLHNGGDPDAAFTAHMREQDALFSQLNAVAKTQWLEFETLLSGYLLSSQGDRMALANGVENRCPFMDPQLLAWAFSLPLEYRLNGGTQEKHILKRAFARELPDSVISRFKRPYLAPDAASFLGENCPDYLDGVLSLDELKKIDVLDSDFAAKFVDKLKNTEPSKIAPRDNQAFLLLLSLSLLDRYFVRKQHSQLTCEPTLSNIVVSRDLRQGKVRNNDQSLSGAHSVVS
ncbi:MAG TPA: asparagine synthase (glutamine-hydrolyzing) [Trichormus sp.]